MPRLENYVNPNPYATPEPHFKPFYTGWVPGFGPKKQFLSPKTYEVATHELMLPHPIAGKRLGFILEIPVEDLAARHREDFYIKQHENFAADLKRRKDTVPGYKGHIPKSKDVIGLTYQKAVKKATADFNKILSDELAF